MSNLLKRIVAISHSRIHYREATESHPCVGPNVEYFAKTLFLRVKVVRRAQKSRIDNSAFERRYGLRRGDRNVKKVFRILAHRLQRDLQCHMGSAAQTGQSNFLVSKTPDVRNIRPRE